MCEIVQILLAAKQAYSWVLPSPPTLESFNAFWLSPCYYITLGLRNFGLSNPELETLGALLLLVRHLVASPHLQHHELFCNLSIFLLPHLRAYLARILPFLSIPFYGALKTKWRVMIKKKKKKCVLSLLLQGAVVLWMDLKPCVWEAGPLKSSKTELKWYVSCLLWKPGHLLLVAGRILVHLGRSTESRSTSLWSILWDLMFSLDLLLFGVSLGIVLVPSRKDPRRNASLAYPRVTYVKWPQLCFRHGVLIIFFPFSYKALIKVSVASMWTLKMIC